jgi:hypothetical protein
MDTEENLIQLETPVANSSEIKVTASNHLELGLMYKQSHAARESANPICATIFNNDNTVKFESGPMTRIGGLDWPGEPETLRTFHGGRIAKLHRVVNENISLSFDPRNLECLGCTSHHNITKQSPFTLILADQNFIPFLTDADGNCVPVARMENASLCDLVDFGFELLDKFIPPPGSVIMLGSASHLFRVGAGMYAKDLIESRTKLNARWRNIHICPLPPLSGKIVRE